MIYDANSIDIMAKKDGRVELFIISSGAIDASPKTQKLLLDKVENYLLYLENQEFQREFSADKAEVSIILELEEAPPKTLSELCQKIESWVADYGAKFILRVRKQE